MGIDHLVARSGPAQRKTEGYYDRDLGAETAERASERAEKGFGLFGSSEREMKRHRKTVLLSSHLAFLKSEESF